MVRDPHGKSVLDGARQGKPIVTMVQRNWLRPSRCTSRTTVPASICSSASPAVKGDVRPRALRTLSLRRSGSLKERLGARHGGPITLPMICAASRRQRDGKIPFYVDQPQDGCLHGDNSQLGLLWEVPVVSVGIGRSCRGIYIHSSRPIFPS